MGFALKVLKKIQGLHVPRDYRGPRYVTQAVFCSNYLPFKRFLARVNLLNPVGFLVLLSHESGLTAVKPSHTRCDTQSLATSNHPWDHDPHLETSRPPESGLGSMDLSLQSCLKIWDQQLPRPDKSSRPEEPQEPQEP